MIARVMGPLLVLLGFWFLFFQKTVTELRKTSTTAVIYLAGVINLIIGVIIIVGYPVWSLDIFLSVTLLGWFAALRGVYMVYMPHHFLGTKPPGGFVLKIYGILPLVWGIILIYAGFFS